MREILVFWAMGLCLGCGSVPPKTRSLADAPLNELNEVQAQERADQLAAEIVEASDFQEEIPEEGVEYAEDEPSVGEHTDLLELSRQEDEVEKNPPTPEDQSLSEELAQIEAEASSEKKSRDLASNEMCSGEGCPETAPGHEDDSEKREEERSMGYRSPEMLKKTAMDELLHSLDKAESEVEDSERSPSSQDKNKNKDSEEEPEHYDDGDSTQNTDNKPKESKASSEPEKSE